MKLTKIKIEKLANEIAEFLKKECMLDGTCIYYNNKRIKNGVLENGEFDPHDYFEYAAYNHILSMSFDGEFYHMMNYNGGIKLNKFNKILDKYGVYYELGYAWSLTLYPSSDDMEIEYTHYVKPPQTIELYYNSLEKAPKEIQNIMIAWFELSKLTGDEGSCTIGDGFEFKYNENQYWMSPCSPYQGSMSYEAHIKTVKTMLKNIGATDIYYKYGYLD